SEAVQKVADDLRNTPAVCRKSYINPVVFHAWQEGVLHEQIRDDIKRLSRRTEQIALSFLRDFAARGKRAAAKQADVAALLERSLSAKKGSAKRKPATDPAVQAA